MTITAHCLIKNEENFIWYAIKSVVDYVDKIIVFDTGSEDKTVEIIRKLTAEYPNKIIFEEKGPADKERHTKLRNEMIEKTQTDWFMILDGDEVWTKRGMEEARLETARQKYDCLIAPFYLCVGDIYHFSKKGQYLLRGIKAHATPRFYRRQEGLHWEGQYNFDAICDLNGQKIFESEKVIFLKEKFWHLTHLVRSSKDSEDYSSGSSRLNKRRLTYFFIGSRITEPVPEVFATKGGIAVQEMNFSTSLGNFLKLAINKIFYDEK